MITANYYNKLVKFRINYCKEDLLFLERINSTDKSKKKKDFKEKYFKGRCFCKFTLAK